MAVFSTFFPTYTPQSDYDENELVCDLIDDETKDWKWNRLCDRFRSQEVVDISMIYVSKNELPDELVWHFEKKKGIVGKNCLLALRIRWMSGTR